MGKIISIFNQKGGIGKSTTSINLSAGLGVEGKRVLLIDMDPQANSTVGVGIDDESLDLTIFDLLKKRKTTKSMINETIKSTEYKNIDVLPSDITLSDAEISLSNSISRETILRRILENIKDDYDYIIIDCPPSLGLLSVNSLCASDGVLIPVSTSFFSVKGIKHLFNTINLVKEELNPELQIIGVLITMFDKRKNIAKDIKESLIDTFGDKVFNTVIRTNSQIEYAQDSNMPIMYYNKTCNGYIDYMNLIEEVLDYEW